MVCFFILDLAWSDIDTATSSILELSLPQDTVVIKRPIFDQDDENSVGYYQAIVLDPNPKAVIFDFFPLFLVLNCLIGFFLEI